MQIDLEVHWTLSSLAEEAGYGEDKTSICVNGLLAAGLLRTLLLYGGSGYEISDLGEVVLEVLRAHRATKEEA